MVAPRKAALVGCGRMGAFTNPAVRRDAPACWFPLSHAEAIVAHPGLTLAGVTDFSVEAAQRAADAHGSPPVFADVPSLLAGAQPALLCVATRTVGRADIIAQAISAGVRALHVEKPLCNSMAELNMLEPLLARNDVHITLGAIRRLMAPYCRAKAYVDSGALGKLLEIQINLGAGALCWTHPHSIDLLLFAAGDRAVDDVSATLGAVETGSDGREILNDPELHAATLRFEDGVIGRITRVPGADLVFACEHGVVAVEADGHRIRELAFAPGASYPQWSDWPLAPVAGPAGTLAALSQLVDCLDGMPAALAENAVLKRDIVRGQELLFAILQSNAEGGGPVRPDNVSADWAILALSHGKYA